MRHQKTIEDRRKLARNKTTSSLEDSASSREAGSSQCIARSLITHRTECSMPSTRVLSSSLRSRREFMCEIPSIGLFCLRRYGQECRSCSKRSSTDLFPPFCCLFASSTRLRVPLVSTFGVTNRMSLLSHRSILRRNNGK